MLSKFDYVKPQSLAQALAYLANNTDTKILAGGTDLMVLMRRNIEMPQHILDIKAIPEAMRMDYDEVNGLFIGAAVPINQLGESQELLTLYPALVQAANAVASYQLRNRATVVGNICNASPGADLAGPLLAYDAQVHIHSAAGERCVALQQFFTGVKKTVLQPTELVIGISVPAVSAGDNSIFYKQARIKGHDLGIVAVTARRTKGQDIKLAMTAVAMTPIRLTQLEAKLNAEALTPQRATWAAEEVRTMIKPITDVRASAEYRLHIAGVLVKRALLQLQEREGNEHVQ